MSHFNDHYQARIKWLEQLKAGDEVALQHYTQWEFTVVDRATPTQIIVKGHKFRRSNGSEIADYSHACIDIPTDELKEREQNRKQKNKALCRIHKIRQWEHLELFTLEAIVALLPVDSN